MAKQLKIKTSNTEWENVDNLKLYELELLNDDTNTAKLSINGKNITVTDDKFYFDAPIDLGNNNFITNGIIKTGGLNINDEVTIENNGKIIGSSIVLRKTYKEDDQEKTVSTTLNVDNDGNLLLNNANLDTPPYIYGGDLLPTDDNSIADQKLLYIQQIEDNYYILWAYLPIGPDDTKQWTRLNAIWG